MKLVSILTDAISGETYGYAIKSGNSVTYVGANENASDWATWANAERKSINDFELPYGVSGGNFEIPSEELASTLNIKDELSTNKYEFSWKSGSIKHDIEKDFADVAESRISSLGASKLAGINFKALSFKNEVKLSSFVNEVRANNYAFDMDTNRFNSKSNGAERAVFHDSLRQKMSKGFERRTGNAIINAIDSVNEPIERQVVGFNTLEKKEIGPKIGSGAARLGRRALGASNAVYDPNAIDADADKLVQEGTPFERPDTRSKPVERVLTDAARAAKPGESATQNLRANMPTARGTLRGLQSARKPGAIPKRTTGSEPKLARYPGQLDANKVPKPKRTFDEETLQKLYDSFTGKKNENIKQKYTRVAKEFDMTPHDVEAHVNEMHRGSRLRLPLVMRPEEAGFTPSEAAKKIPAKKKYSDAQIYNMRTDGLRSLADVAEETGLTRSEVRQAEQRYMRTAKPASSDIPEVDTSGPRGMNSRRGGTTMRGRDRRAAASVQKMKTKPAAKEDLKGKYRVGAGKKKVSDKDGSMWNSLTPEQQAETEQALRKRMLEVERTLKGGDGFLSGNSRAKKTGFYQYWQDQMAGAEKQGRRGGRYAPRDVNDPLLNVDLTEMQSDLDAAIAAGKIKTANPVDKQGNPRLKFGEPELSDAEKLQRLIDDMQVFVQMRESNNWSMIEHLHPESQLVAAKVKGGDDKITQAKARKAGLIQPESTFFGRSRGFASTIESRAENMDLEKLAKRRKRLLRVNPERKARRELRRQRKTGKAVRVGRQLRETDPALALKQRQLRMAAAKRELAGKFRRSRSAEAIAAKIEKAKGAEKRLVTRNDDGTVSIAKDFAPAIASVARSFENDKSRLSSSEARKQAIANLWENTGYMNEPTLIKKDEVQTLLDAGWEPIIRGTGREEVRSESYVEQFLTNPSRFIPGQGGEVHGFGEYFSERGSSQWTGHRGDPSTDRHTILALVPPSARVVDKASLKKDQQEMKYASSAAMDKIAELGGGDAAKAMTSGELATALRGVLDKNNKKDGVSYQIMDHLVSSLEEMDKSGKDSAQLRADVVDSIDFMNKLSGTDQEGKFAPLVNVGLERSTSGVFLLHDRSAIAAVNVPLTSNEAEALATRVSKAPKLSNAQKKARGTISIKNWTQVGGQRGSNAGGTFKDPKGVEHYVKQPSTLLHAENEVLASRLYNLAGVQTPDINLGDENGQARIVSTIRTDLSPIDGYDLKYTFVANAWLGNWDAMLNNNTQLDKNGKAVIIDTGGAMLFRAQGSRKGTGGSTPFGNTVGEMDTLRDRSVNPSAARVFADLDADQIKRQVDKLKQISADEIRKTVSTMISDMTEADSLANTLIARQQDIIRRFG